MALLLFCGLAAPGARPPVAVAELPTVTPARAAAAVIEPTVEPTVEPEPTVELTAAPAPVEPTVEPTSAPIVADAPAAAVSGPVQPVGGACPDAAPIKGNRDSMIYHVPGGRSYSRTKPEQCFATAADAEAAGYRAAKR